MVVHLAATPPVAAAAAGKEPAQRRPPPAPAPDAFSPPSSSGAARHGGGAPPTPGYTRWVLLSLVIGTALEWYDFSALAQLNGPLSANFFPAEASSDAKALGFWMVYAAAFAVRPLGAVAFGSVGDTCGRKVSLVATLALMGCSTVLIGCLPSYAMLGRAGPLAPALLCVLRIAMGLSLGAEYTTAIAYVLEAAPQRLKALHASLVAAACASGSLVGLVVIIAVDAGTDDAQMALWGWRVPFLSAAPIVGVALLLRARMSESEAFLEAARCGEGASPAGSKAGWPAAVVDAPAAEAPAQPCAGEGRGPAGSGRRHGGCGNVGCCGPAARTPLAQLLRRRGLGLVLDTTYVTWLASAIYVVYAWMPAALRASGAMSTLTSLGMALTSLVVEFGGILAGGWVAPRAPCLPVMAAAAPGVSAFVLAALFVVANGSAAGTWVMQNAALGLCGFVLGIHSACWAFIYPTGMRSTGFSLAYNAGCALGGTAPAVVTALGMVAPAAVLHIVPALWLLCLSLPGAGAALWLLRVAPAVNWCGRHAVEGGAAKGGLPAVMGACAV